MGLETWKMRCISMSRAVTSLKNWPNYFAEMLQERLPAGFSPGAQRDVVYKFRNGVLCKVRSNTYDRHVLGEVWFREYYTPKGFDVRRHDVVVDIGAHIGVFSVYASHLAKDGKVIAVEPEDRNFALLEENLKLNSCKNVIAINNAVASADGVVKFYTDPSSTAGHSLHKGAHRDGGREIKCITLSTLMTSYNIPHIDFLKIDCEGAEYDIIFECPPDVLARVKKISLECHPIDSEKNITVLANFLSERGFATHVRKNPDMIYALRN